MPEKLRIPFSAVKGFFDPSVQFGLQFPIEGDGEMEIPEGLEAASEDELDEQVSEESGAPAENTPGEVVSLDTFRNK